MTDNNRDEVLNDLIDRHLRGDLNESEQGQLAELLDSRPDARKAFVEVVRWETELSGFLQVKDQKPEIEKSHASRPGDGQRSRGQRLLRSLLVLSTVVIIGLTALLIRERSGRMNEIAATNEADSSIARITGLSGALIWTGDRGQIMRDISIGTELAGGTIEGMAPDSWLELQFNDKSTVMISGT